MTTAMTTQKEPSELIRHAIDKGVDLDKIEKLLEIQIKWEANEARKAYHVAMAKFKENPPKITKDKKVGYSTAKGNVGYSHATLGNVTEKIGSALSKHGLSASWIPKQGQGAISLTCRITHSLGHSEECTITAAADDSGSKNHIQAIGSAISYMERYTLLALTGLATYDQDDDGASAITEYISEREQHQIADLIAEASINMASFLSYMKVERLELIPKAKFKQAVAAIEEKKRQAGSGKK